MKKTFLKIFFSLSICLVINFVCGTLLSYAADNNVTTTNNTEGRNIIAPTLGVSIPGFGKFSDVNCNKDNPDCSIPWIGEYIGATFKYSLIAIAILAIVVMMIGGVIWLTSGGNQERIGQGKEFVRNGILGVTLAFCAYLVLFLINSNLTILPPVKVAYIAKEDLPDAQEYKTIIDSGGHVPPPKSNAPKSIVSVIIDTISGQKSVQVDQSIADVTKKTFQEIKNAGFNVYEAGGYRVSTHCHGEGKAIDINVKENYCIDCYGKKGAKVGEYFKTEDQKSAKQKIVQIFKQNGWCWGGDWKSFKDYMHFSIQCTHHECGENGRYDWGKSPQKNQQDLGISWP